MEAIIKQIRDHFQKADAAGRRQIIDSLASLQYQIESPYETVQRFAGLNLQITAARVGVDLGVFNALYESKVPLTLDELSQKSDATPETLSRILRYLASVGMIKETGKDTFSASPITATLANEAYQGAVHHFFDNIGPVFQLLPDFLRETKYADITSNTNLPFQKAFDTDLPAFAWMPTQPQRFYHLQQAMTIQQAGAPNWFEVFPFEKELGDWSQGTIFVDIGGGFGHRCQELRQAFPSTAGKLVLQDLPQTLEHVSPIDGVDIMAHNFFQEQPVRGAKFYYLHNILHDWPDEQCVRILQNIIQAMGEDSRILIDEMVIPNVGAHWHATQIDLTMMACLGSKERTLGQWHKLLDAAGLRIICIKTYITPKQDSIVMAVPK